MKRHYFGNKPRKISPRKFHKEEGTIIHPFEVVHATATEKQIDSLTQGLDEEDYSIITDDAYYYTAQAQKYLDSMKIKP